MMGTKQESMDITDFINNQSQINFAEFEDIKHFEIGEISYENILDPTLNNAILPNNFLPTELLVTNDEDTLDVGTLYTHEYIPICSQGPPDRHVYNGDLNFELHVNSSDTHKKKYLYSYKLNRIYVDMECNFPIQFSWNYKISPQPMYVRATTVFSDDSQMEKRVETCLQHKDPGNNSNTGLAPHIFNHVLRSTRPASTSGVHYTGEVTNQHSWYSVLVTFPTCPENSVGYCSHVYKFACKNSCSSGINRRAIDIIFTLEDAKGVVYGRQLVSARVCACPRRDMLKDEKDFGVYVPGKKRVQSNMVAPEVRPTPGKKIKLEVKDDDDEVFTLPPLQIVGAKTMNTCLTVALNVMEQVGNCKKNDPKALEKYNKAIEGLRAYLDKLKNM